MMGELVQVTTLDRVRLHGFFSAPTQPAELQLDAAVLLHGLGGNFYSSRLLDRMAQTLADLQLATLQVNTRGHDTISVAVVGLAVRSIGAAHETVADCRMDVRAWIDWLADRGLRRVLLVGHSLGSIKALYSQAWDPHPHVVGLVAVSASRLSYSRFAISPAREVFLKQIQIAQDLTADGAGEQLLQVDFPFPTPITAGTYVDKYGPEERYNWLRFAHKLSVPLLLIFGEKEIQTNASFEGILEDISQLSNKPTAMATDVVPGADHFFTGATGPLCKRIRQWVVDQFS